MKNFLVILAISVFSLAIFNVANAYDPACNPGPYNTRTGKLCSVEDKGTVCKVGEIYSTVTGKRCDVWEGNSTSLNVVSPLKITTNQIPSTVRLGGMYSAEINATGGSYDNTWSIVSGSLPSGLSLKSNPNKTSCIQSVCSMQSSAVISGRLTRRGTYEFIVGITSGTNKDSKFFAVSGTNY